MWFSYDRRPIAYDLIASYQNRMLEKSIIVVAHPDDEVLWFSSLLERVDCVVFCYVNSESKPQLSIERRKSLSEYPVKKICCSYLVESEVFSRINWHNPEITKYGLRILKKDTSEKRYRKNFGKLKQYLRGKLTGYLSVFTHNPWGEYGHEEHVQVFRAVKELQQEMGFDLWFSNYCSNKSFDLMLGYMNRLDVEYMTLKTDKVISRNIKELYTQHGCWTWYNDWEWFDDESFIKEKSSKERAEKYGRAFPLNLIKVRLSGESNTRPSRFRNYRARLKKKLKALVSVVG